VANAEESRLVVEFFNSLVYGYHRKTFSDGFIDLKYEALVIKHGNPIEKLTQDEINTVKIMHGLTIKYGYLILKLYTVPDYSTFGGAFINSPLKVLDPPSTSYYYPYPEKDNNLKSVQISIPPNEVHIKSNWDLAIFCCPGDKLYHIREQLKGVWGLEGKQLVGDRSKYRIALYIDRNHCKRTHVLNTLELQMGWLDFETAGSIAVFPHNADSPSFIEEYANPKNFLPNAIDAFRLSEGLVEKSWAMDQNNCRRAIGIYHWDIINSTNSHSTSKQSLLKRTIKHLRTHNSEILEHFHSNYNASALRDTMKVQNTVIREMELDYNLTNLCIDKARYFSPPDIKKNKN